MDASFWTIKNLRTGVEQTVEDWGISQDITITRRSAAIGTAQFRFGGLNSDSAAPWNAGDIIWLKRNGVGFWMGRCRSPTRIASANNESLQYTVDDPWIFLDSIPYTQSWQIANDPDNPHSTLSVHSLSRVLLFYLAGSKVDTVQQILHAIGIAQGGGAYLAANLMSLPVVRPRYSEITDSTCGEIIRQCLRWHPDAVTWFDYSGAVPLLNIAQRSSLTILSRAAFDDPTQQIAITARDDLLVSGVRITYESTHNINELSWKTISEDAVGVRGFRSPDFTVQLSGSSLTYQSQQLTILGVTVTTRAFWEGALPWLHQATGVTIEDVRINNQLVTGQSADASDATSGYDGLGTEDFTGASLGAPFSTNVEQNLLAGGQVPNWLASHFKDAVIAAKISYTILNGDTQAEEQKVKIPFTVKVKHTDLNNSPFPQTVSQTISSTDAEPVPTGIAAAFYAANSVLQYQGSYQIQEDECSGEVTIGCALNLTGGASEWASMNAMITSVTENLGSGKTNVGFGPAPHLSVNDFIELQRLERYRQHTFRLQEQITGVSYGQSGQMFGAIQTPQNTPSPHSQPGKKLVLADLPASNPSQIQMFTDDVVAAVRALSDPHIKLREIRVCNPADPTATNWRVQGLFSDLYQV